MAVESVGLTHDSLVTEAPKDVLVNTGYIRKSCDMDPKDSIAGGVPTGYTVGKATSSLSGKPLKIHPRTQKVIFVKNLLSSSAGLDPCWITFFHYKCFPSVIPYFSRWVGQL